MLELLLIGVVVAGILYLFFNMQFLQNIANIFSAETEGLAITDDGGAERRIVPIQPFKLDDYQAPKMNVIPPTDQIFRVDNPELADISIDEMPYYDTLTPIELEKLRRRYQAILEETI